MLWASGYGGLVLALAQRHGIEVPKDEFERVMKYLSQGWRSFGAERSELADSALALYALAVAGLAEPGYHERLYSLRGNLSTEDRALLALAIAESHGPAEMTSQLLSSNAVSRPDEHR